MLLDKINLSDNAQKYERVPSAQNGDHELESHRPRPETHRITYLSITAILMVLSAVVGFATSSILYSGCRGQCTSLSDITIDDDLQPRVRLDTVSRTFKHDKQFEKAPPSGPGAGNISEPIWDALIPKGLGYVSHPSIPTTSIPTVFHQLHCLYTIRRAYYAVAESKQGASDSSSSGDPDLQRWDLGKPRTVHVAHCFDFLQQGLTCSADSTLEPAIDHEHEFLGTGFQRQCRDYEGLKAFAEEHRVFESEGFLAEGIDIHGARANG